MGYWMNPPANLELGNGAVLILSERGRGRIRCSQLCEMVLHYFFVQPENLSCVLTIPEQNVLYEVSRRREHAVRLVPVDNPMAGQFQCICEAQNSCAPLSRLQTLELFLRTFAKELDEKDPVSVCEDVAGERLEKLLNEMRPEDMLELSFTDLAGKVGCSPRHLARIFPEVTGVSFREKQAEIRLSRAQNLLTSTNAKVIDVALESGYQSLSLFNLMFKRRFGVTPAQWREQRTHPPKPFRSTDLRWHAGAKLVHSLA
jgi:AraC-like DNA-binding protein